MKSDRNIAVYHRMHNQLFWQLLTPSNRPPVIALFQSHPFETACRLMLEKFRASSLIYAYFWPWLGLQ